MEGRPCEYEALDVVSRDTPAGDDYRLFIAVAGRTTRQMLRRTAVSTSRYSGCAFPCRVGLISDAKPGNQDYNGGRRIRAEINHVALCPQHAHADEDGDLNPANLFSTGDFFECPLYFPRRGNSPSQELSLMEQAPLVAAPIVRGANAPSLVLGRHPATTTQCHKTRPTPQLAGSQQRERKIWSIDPDERACR